LGFKLRVYTLKSRIENAQVGGPELPEDRQQSKKHGELWVINLELFFISEIALFSQRVPDFIYQ